MPKKKAAKDTGAKDEAEWTKLNFDAFTGNKDVTMAELTDSERKFLSDMDAELGGHGVKLISRVGASFEDLSFDEARHILEKIKEAVIRIAAERARDRWLRKNREPYPK